MTKTTQQLCPTYNPFLVCDENTNRAFLVQGVVARDPQSRDSRLCCKIVVWLHTVVPALFSGGSGEGGSRGRGVPGPPQRVRCRQFAVPAARNAVSKGAD